jgi:hypothetical protein
MSDPTLWGVYDFGLDEWHAFPSQEVSEKFAAEMNSAWAHRKNRQSDVMHWAIPDLWPFSAEEHAKSLQDHMPMQMVFSVGILQAYREIA